MHTFDRIIGYQEEKKELMQLCDMLRNREYYERLGAKLPRGLLICGDPGLGKSLMARCFMEEVGWNSYTVRRSKPDGDFVRELSRVFQEAAENAPAIILLDDMDKFVVEEKSTEEYVAVQAGIDEVAGKEVYVIATANDLDDIPDSLLRAGRFDRKITVDCPSGEDAVKIIDFYLRSKTLGSTVNTADVAKMLSHSSCAELETILNEAAIYAGYERSQQIEMGHIVEAALRNEYGISCEEAAENEHLRWQIAYHEAGHAVMLDLLKEGGVGFISIRPDGSGHGGSTHAYALPNTNDGNILISLAGLATTELKYGIKDIGGTDDLDNAMRRIRNNVSSRGVYGINLVNPRLKDSDTLLTRQEAVTAAELERYLAKTRTILLQNMEFLDALAGELYEKGILLNSDVKRIRERCTVNCPSEEAV